MKTETMATINRVNQTAEVAWLAGFFDGEGCIYTTTNSYKDKDGRRRRYPTNPRLSVGNRSLPCLLRMRRIMQDLGAKAHLRFSKTSRGKPFGAVYVHESKGLIRVLKAMLPWLAVKSQRAELAIKVLERQVANWDTRKGWARKDDEQLSWIEEIKELNRRGGERLIEDNELATPNQATQGTGCVEGVETKP